MNAGAVDIHADVADAVPIFTQSAKAPLTFYARERGAPSAEAIIVPADSPIRTVADLRGRTVGVSRGSGSHYVLAAALKRSGLTLADIKPAYLQAPEGAVAFDQGALDAWSIWDPFLAFAEAKRPVRVIADGNGLTSYHRYYVVNDGFVAAHPEVVATVYRALVEAGAWMRPPGGGCGAAGANLGRSAPGGRGRRQQSPDLRGGAGGAQPTRRAAGPSPTCSTRRSSSPAGSTPRTSRSSSRRRAGAEAVVSAPRFGIWAAVHGSRASHHDPDEPDDASWERNRALVLEAEALGFDAVLVAQHTMNPYDPQRDQLEAWTGAAALAALTRRIEIIAAIKPGLYHPVVLAKMALQIEHISGGRFALNLVKCLEQGRVRARRTALPRTRRPLCLWPRMDRPREPADARRERDLPG